MDKSIKNVIELIAAGDQPHVSDTDQLPGHSLALGSTSRHFCSS